MENNQHKAKGGGLWVSSTSSVHPKITHQQQDRGAEDPARLEVQEELGAPGRTSADHVYNVLAELVHTWETGKENHQKKRTEEGEPPVLKHSVPAAAQYQHSP